MNLQSILKTISLRPPVLRQVIPCCGAIALALYRLLYSVGVDGRGLLKSFHFSWVLLCLLSIAAGGLILAGTARYPDSDARVRRSVPAAAGCTLAAVSTLVTGLLNLFSRTPIYGLAALLAAAAFAGVALCRFQGRRANFLMHGVVCVHFLFQLLLLYQTNSFDPQIQDYFFQTLACIALAVTAYQLAAADLGQGSPRWLWCASLAAVYLCLLCLGSSATGLFLTGALWAFTALPLSTRKREKERR